MPEHLLIHVDGGSRGNPGPAGAGVTIAEKGGGVLFEAGFHLPEMTNNAAEYHGLIRALEVCDAWPAAQLTIHSDSELMVKQLTGSYRVKSAALAELFEAAQQKLLRRDQWRIVHVPRERNSRADALANRAMDAADDVIVIDRRGSNDSRPAGNGRAAPSTPATTHDNADRESVIVRCTSAPKEGACPAPCERGTRYAFGDSAPAGMCLGALGAMLNTILAIREAPREPGQSMPALTVRCFSRGCGAAFEITTPADYDDEIS